MVSICDTLSLSFKLFGHRGLLHYSVFWLILGILIAKYNHFTQGLFFGVSGHLFLDACTYKGIPGLGWFLDKKKSFYIFPKKWKMYVGKPRTNVVSGILTIGVRQNFRIHWNKS